MSMVYAMLTDTLGKDGADALVSAFGGSHLYIGGAPTPEVVHVLGTDLADWLCERHRGECLNIPRRPEIQRLERNRAIIAARMEGMTMRTLARTFRLTERHLNSILKDHRAFSEATNDAATVEPPTPAKRKRSNG